VAPFIRDLKLDLLRRHNRRAPYNQSQALPPAIATPASAGAALAPSRHKSKRDE
jgi:hypothetical protein